MSCAESSLAPSSSVVCPTRAGTSHFGAQLMAGALGSEDGDCASCRVIGTGVCFGTSGTLAAQLYRGTPAVHSPAHRAVLLAFSAGFAVLGVARAVI